MPSPQYFPLESIGGRSQQGASKDVLKDQIDKMKSDSIKSQERQERVGNIYINRLVDVEIVDPLKAVASRYL